MNDHFLDKKLNERNQNNSLRTLQLTESTLIDFSSNDYLGIVKNELIEKKILGTFSHGSTGSRLLSGNYPLIEETENWIAEFHDAEAGLIFNSGYEANTGLLSCVCQKNDTIIYDQLSHASLRDGIRLSNANSFSFLHNDLDDLEKKLRAAETGQQKFVVTESVFSMDGDYAPLKEIHKLCENYNAALIVDEAHATGVIGPEGAGLVQYSGLQSKCFARIHTFGKACGTHGAIILGSQKLKNYLVNFSRQFIYSTSLPPCSIEAIRQAYQVFPMMKNERNHLKNLIHNFKKPGLKFKVLKSDSPIQVIIIPGNEEVKKIASMLRQKSFNIRPILYPTVPKGQERLRIVLHAFNTTEEITRLLDALSE